MSPPRLRGGYQLAAVLAVELLAQPAGALPLKGSTISCPRSCRTSTASAAAPPSEDEVIGETSRCFSTPGASGGWRCLQVQCDMASGTYKVGSAEGKWAECAAVGTAADVSVSVSCEHFDDVCDSRGSVVAAMLERRRVGAAASLARQFSATAVRDLMPHFDAGRLLVHLPEEHGLNNSRWMVGRTSKGCQLGSWLVHVKHQHLLGVDMTLLEDVKEQGLLAALQEPSGCLAYVEQDAMAFAIEDTGLRGGAEPQRLQNEVEQDALAFAIEDTGLRGGAEPRRLQNLNALPWGLSFLDPASSDAGDGVYAPQFDGSGVDVYVFGTGIDDTHPLLVNSMDNSQSVDYVNSPVQTRDLHGLGTHCAGIVGGDSVGVAKGATLVAMKVLGDSGSGSISVSVEALNALAVESQRRATSGGNPMVASMSLKATVKSEALNNAVNAAFDAGVTVVVAAGNDNQSASFESPCTALEAICVGALKLVRRPRSVSVAEYSNYGPSLLIWAPGGSIISARTRTGSNNPGAVELKTVKSGNSMACAHVAGIAALMLQQDPSRGPEQVRQEMTGNCGPHLERLFDPRSNSARIVRISGGSCLQSNGFSIPGLPNIGGFLGMLLNGLFILCCLGCCGMIAMFAKRQMSGGSSSNGGTSGGIQMGGGAATAAPSATREVAAATAGPIDFSNIFFGSTPAGWKPPAAGALQRQQQQQQQPFGAAAPSAPQASSLRASRAKQSKAVEPEAAAASPGGGGGWFGGGGGGGGMSAVEAQQPKLAKAIQEAKRLNADPREFARSNGSVFPQLRMQLKALAKTPGVLDLVPDEEKYQVYEFVCAVVEKRKMMKGQGKEIIKTVLPRWPLDSRPDLVAKMNALGIAA